METVLVTLPVARVEVGLAVIEIELLSVVRDKVGAVWAEEKR